MEDNQGFNDEDFEELEARFDDIAQTHEHQTNTHPGVVIWQGWR